MKDLSKRACELKKQLAELSKNEQAGLSLEDKAYFLVCLKKFNDAAARFVNAFEEDLRASGNFNFEFKELNMSAYLQAGAKMTEISVDIVDDLSIDEIKKCAKFTEKGLKEIGKKDLIEKYKLTKGSRKASIKIERLEK